jgi:hypothetical protein
MLERCKRRAFWTFGPINARKLVFFLSQLKKKRNGSKGKVDRKAGGLREKEQPEQGRKKGRQTGTDGPH